jgi:hypothetical protein
VEKRAQSENETKRTTHIQLYALMGAISFNSSINFHFPLLFRSEQKGKFMESLSAKQYTAEQQAKWLFDNMLRPGIRIAFIYDDPKAKDQKKAYGLLDCVRDNDFFRKLLLAHCQGSPASAEVRFIEKHSTFHKRVDVCRLGSYFGGDTDLGNNVVLTYALDCDRSDDLQRFIDSLPPDESKDEKWREQPGVTALLENEPQRLREMMQETVAAFPGAMFFARPDNGKWHMHGGLRETRPACAVKAWATDRLPRSCSHIEVFPKNSDGELEVGKWFNGNLIRAPFATLKGRYMY